MRQGKIAKAVMKRDVAAWRQEGPPTDKVRLNAYAAKGAGKLWGAVPSKTLDMNVSKQDL